MDFLQKLTEVAKPNHTELLPTCFVSQDTLDSIRYTRWVGDAEADTVSLVAVLKNGKELFLMQNVPSEVMFSLIENHPSAPGNVSRSESRSDSLDDESASHGVYESDDESGANETNETKEPDVVTDTNTNDATNDETTDKEKDGVEEHKSNDKNEDA